MRPWLLVVALFVVQLAQGQEVRRALPVDAPVVDNANDIAQFLAGRPVASLAAYQQSSIYQNHVAEMTKLWNRYYESYFTKMGAWSATELAPRIPMSRPVIYFFGGPDAASPLAYYPDAPAYLLGGLEPVGSIAPISSLTPEALDEALANLRRSVESVLSYGFFITKDMKVDLDRAAFRGVLPVMSSFIALAGGEILSTSYIGIDSSGNLQDYGTTYAGGKGVSPGVKIVFRRSLGAGTQTIYYVQSNVVDDAVKSNPGVLKWAGQFGPGNVYLKAASYLTHETYFGRIRSFLLENASSVLQDDSGIPYKFFAQNGWRTWLFGTYTGTLDIFTKYYQPDLTAAFANPADVLPLPFGTGYKWRQGQSNLLLAVPPAKALR